MGANGADGITGIKAAGVAAALVTAAFLAAGAAVGTTAFGGAMAVEGRTVVFKGEIRAGDTNTFGTVLPGAITFFTGGTGPISEAVRIPLTTSGAFATAAPAELDEDIHPNDNAPAPPMKASPPTKNAAIDF